MDTLAHFCSDERHKVELRLARLLRGRACFTPRTIDTPESKELPEGLDEARRGIPRLNEVAAEQVLRVRSTQRVKPHDVLKGFDEAGFLKIRRNRLLDMKHRANSREVHNTLVDDLGQDVPMSPRLRVSGLGKHNPVGSTRIGLNFAEEHPKCLLFPVNQIVSIKRQVLQREGLTPVDMPFGQWFTLRHRRSCDARKCKQPAGGGSIGNAGFTPEEHMTHPRIATYGLVTILGSLAGQCPWSPAYAAPVDLFCHKAGFVGDLGLCLSVDEITSTVAFGYSYKNSCDTSSETAKITDRKVTWSFSIPNVGTTQYALDRTTGVLTVVNDGWPANQRSSTFTCKKAAPVV